MTSKKISDLITTTNQAENGNGGKIHPFVSLEFFPPRTNDGEKNLNERIGRLKENVNPLFVDFTWGADGSTADSTLDLTVQAKNVHNLIPNMHLTCTNMPKSKIDTALSECKKNGIQNIVALRGDPPAGESHWEASENGFSCALDLIRYIKKNHDDYFCLSVAGYPEGHPDKIKSRPEGIDSLSASEMTRYNLSRETGEITVCSDQDWNEELNYLKGKCEAGADLIITQMFFDVEVFKNFRVACRNNGIKVPIIPGIMCINSFSSFERMTNFCKTRVPEELFRALEAAKGDDAAIKSIGIDHGTNICKTLLEIGVPGLHFYTLNLEIVPLGILKNLHLIKNVDSEADGKVSKIIRASLEDMPGLVNCLKEIPALHSNPFEGAKITASLYINAQNAALIKALRSFGAEVRWCNSAVLGMDMCVAEGIGKDEKIKIFACEDQNLKTYWKNSIEALVWEDKSGPNLVIDECGDLSVILHEGVKVEETDCEEKSGEPKWIGNGPDFKILNEMLCDNMAKEPQCWHRITRRIQGLTVGTISAAHKMLRLEGSGSLRLAVINTRDSITRSLARAHLQNEPSAEGKKMFSGRLHRVRSTLGESLAALLNVEMKGKIVLVYGYGDVGSACASSITAAGGVAKIIEIDPICALRASMDGYKVVSTEENRMEVFEADIYLSATGVKDTITVNHITSMKDQAAIASISHLNGEVDVAGLEEIAILEEKRDFCSVYQLPNKNKVTLISEGRLLDLSDQMGAAEPNILASVSLSIEALALLELWRERFSGRYTRGTVFSVPRLIDESVARLHLPVYGAKLSHLTKDQSNYMKVDPEGPFKPYAYSYTGSF